MSSFDLTQFSPLPAMIGGSLIGASGMVSDPKLPRVILLAAALLIAFVLLNGTGHAPIYWQDIRVQRNNQGIMVRLVLSHSQMSMRDRLSFLMDTKSCLHNRSGAQDYQWRTWFLGGLLGSCGERKSTRFLIGVLCFAFTWCVMLALTQAGPATQLDCKLSILSFVRH